MKRLVHAVFLLALLSRAYGQPDGGNVAEVRIAGWTTSGERIERIWVVVSTLDCRDTHQGNGRDVVLSVPVGDYVLRVAAPGFQTTHQILKVYRPSVFRSVVLPVSYIHGQKESGLTGTVRHHGPDNRKLRIRLMSLYGDEVWECVPDADGSFRFPATAGAYLLVVVADLPESFSVLYSEPVRIAHGQQLSVSVDLNPNRGTPGPLAPR